MFKIFSSLFVFTLSLNVIAAENISSVDQWLDKMREAKNHQNYQGTLIVRQDDNLQAINVKQGVGENGGWQTMDYQTGEGQIIYRKNGQVKTIFPTKKLLTVSEIMEGVSAKGPLHSLPQNRDEIKQHYEFKLDGEERVANKATQIIKMIPKDRYRYGYTFWLDKQSGLLLKCDLMNSNGRVLEQLMYSNIELLQEAPEKNIDESKLASYEKVMLKNHSDITEKNWQAKKIPAGFMLTRAMKMNQQPAAYHLVYSDGMASVSVFIEEAKNDAEHIGQSSMGLVNAFSLRVNNNHITAIGEVPKSTVRMIAQSMQAIQ